jgi:hypothetical protein
MGHRLVAGALLCTYEGRSGQHEDHGSDPQPLGQQFL